MINIYARKMLLLAGLFTLLSAPVAAIADENEVLFECSYSPFAISFLCDSQWPKQQDAGMVVYFISDSPAVSMTITHLSDKVVFLEQINKVDLEMTNQYADGFVLEDAVINGMKAKMVKAFSKASVDVRYLDYYFLSKGMLYSVLFAVDPKESWDDYKLLIKAIAESIDFK